MVLKEIKMQNEVPVLGWFGADMLLSVEALTPGAPAISSGKIFPGDTLIAVDGKKITSLQEATKLILGEPGSAIKMHFDRHGRRFVVELQRGTTASRGQQSAHDTQERIDAVRAGSL
jgi:C-terminal processing protease CtpA/Prc